MWAGVARTPEEIFLKYIQYPFECSNWVGRLFPDVPDITVSYVVRRMAHTILEHKPDIFWLVKEEVGKLDPFAVEDMKAVALSQN